LVIAVPAKPDAIVALNITVTDLPAGSGKPLPVPLIVINSPASAAAGTMRYSPRLLTSIVRAGTAGAAVIAVGLFSAAAAVGAMISATWSKARSSLT